MAGLQSARQYGQYPRRRRQYHDHHRLHGRPEIGSVAAPHGRGLYAGLTLALLLIEVTIALFVRDAVVRPLIGDVLVMPLVYCALQALRPSPSLPVALGVLGLACAVEIAQGIGLFAALGLLRNPILKIVLGATFDWHDLLAYLAGTLLILLCEGAFAGAERDSARSRRMPGL